MAKLHFETAWTPPRCRKLVLDTQDCITIFLEAVLCGVEWLTSIMHDFGLQLESLLVGNATRSQRI
jgi:hypothetical protein